MTSEIFELITSDDVRFFVHKDILISQSKPFEQATAGPWLEATERKILLSDWDTDTVARLVEFLYRDDYPYPDPRELHLSLALEETTAPLGKSDEVHVEGELDSSQPAIPTVTVVQSKLATNWPVNVSDTQRLEPFDPALYDFELVLLAHAKVYVLAQYKGVESLRALALKRVSLVLSRLQPILAGSHITRNVTELARYVYANTDDRSPGEEPLRKITSGFITENVVAFQKEKCAVRLMAEGGDLVTDLMSKLCRVVDMKDSSSIGVSQKKRYISNIKVCTSRVDSNVRPADWQFRSCSGAVRLIT